MDNITKILLITAIIIIAGLMGIMYTGTTHVKLPVYYATDSLPIEKGKGYKITAAHTIPDFTLINQDGKEVSRKQIEGKITVFDFVFTRCGDICPKMTTQMTRVQEMYEKDEDVKLYTTTVDPAYDSIAVLKAYAKKYGAIAGKWNFLTGAKDLIYPLIHKGFLISAQEDGNLTDTIPAFIHSDKMVLVDKRGWIRGYYDGTNPEEVNRLMTEIRVLKEIYKNKDE